MPTTKGCAPTQVPDGVRTQRGNRALQRRQLARSDSPPRAWARRQTERSALLGRARTVEYHSS
eukprot:6367518-Pyramimonas_sp.AAC.1